MVFNWQSFPIFYQLALGSYPQYISILLANFLLWTIFSFIGFHCAIPPKLSNSSAANPSSLYPGGSPCISSLFILPTCLFSTFFYLDLIYYFFFIVLSRNFPALALVQTQPVGYWTCMFLLHMYSLYCSGGYRKYLSDVHFLKRNLRDYCLWGGGLTIPIPTICLRRPWITCICLPWLFMEASMVDTWLSIVATGFFLTNWCPLY